MAKIFKDQLAIKGKLFKDPKLSAAGTHTKCTFSILFVHYGGDPKTHGRWFNFVAWDEVAEHIAENYRGGDYIHIRSATPKAGKQKCPECQKWTEQGFEWTVKEIDDAASQPASLPDAYEPDGMDSQEVILDDTDIPY